MSLLYNISIHLYLLAIRVSCIFNEKARLWVRGRKGLLSQLSSINPAQKPVIWVHCASLGEFEQGRPVIEALKKDYPDHFMLLTFFSPSGYEIRKDYDQVDLVTYLPIDTKKNARIFLDRVRPDLALFVKYEFWFNYIQEMAGRDIPSVVISANFRKDQHFFKWYGAWFRKKLKLIDAVFVQREDSGNLLQSIGYEDVFVSGDTRFDQVASIASKAEEIEFVKEFKGNQTLVLAGSTWPKDEEIILSAFYAIKDRMKLVIAPHEVHPERIRQLKLLVKDTNILIIDTIGLLSRLYRYADIAYIGGGFGAGIHNTLEAAAYGCPVIFGPNYEKFKEAVELIELGGAFSITDAKQLDELFVKFESEADARQKAAEIAGKYVEENQGATALILGELDKIIRKKHKS